MNLKDSPASWLTLFEESSTPSNPASGQQKLFIRSSDHHFCLVNSAGAVTDLGAISSLVLDDLVDVATGSPGPSDGDVLTYQAGSPGGVWTPQAPTGGGGWTLLETHAASSSPQIDFTNFSASYSKYFLDIDGVTPGTTSQDLYLLISTDGGATFLTATNYYWSHYTSLASGPSGGAAGAGEAQAKLTDASRMVTTSGTSLSGGIYLANMLNGSKFFSFYGHQISWPSATEVANVTVAGGYKVANTPNAVRLLMSSGNIAGGTFRLYGLPI